MASSPRRRIQQQKWQKNLGLQGFSAKERLRSKVGVRRRQ
jgi:hypothetical protein